MILATTNWIPTYSNAVAKRPESHDVTFEINIAAVICLAENKSADIKQNITPTLLFVISIPSSNLLLK